jgi:hypothetical protein
VRRTAEENPTVHGSAKTVAQAVTATERARAVCRKEAVCGTPVREWCSHTTSRGPRQRLAAAPASAPMGNGGCGGQEDGT